MQGGYQPGDKVFSNRLFVGYINSMDQKLGRVMTDEVLAKMQIDRLFLNDLNAYSSDEVSHAITTAAIELTGEKRLPYLMGRNLPNTIGKLQGFVAGVTSPSFFMRGAGEIEERLALKTANKTTQIGKNRFKVEITYKDGFVAQDYVCENRIGCYESAPLFFGMPYAKVEHPQCLHRGGGSCVYIVQFPDSQFLLFQRAAQLLFLAAGACAALAFAGRLGSWSYAVPEGLALGAFAFYALYKHQSAKKSLEWSLSNNEGLVKQNLMLDAVNAKLTSLQRVAAALVGSRDGAEACGSAVKGLVKDLHFGSGQIWLLDPDREFIHCDHAEGYSPEIHGLIMGAKFRYKENWDNPHGLIVRTMVQGKTVIVNDLDEVLPRLTVNARDFLIKLKLSSFIMTPLIHDNKPMGILVGEYHNGEKIEIYDQTIFQSLALVLTNKLAQANAPAGAGPAIASPSAAAETVAGTPGLAAEAVASALQSPLDSLRGLLSRIGKKSVGLEKFRAAVYREAKEPAALAGLKKIDRETGVENALESGREESAQAGSILEKCDAVQRALRLLARSSASITADSVDMAALLRKALESVPRQDLGTMDVMIESAPGLIALADEGAISEICKALILNAAEAMEGRGRLEIRLAAEGNRILCRFIDSGPGVPEAFRDRIFVPFFTTKPPGRGMGMGLAVARNLARGCGGDLSLESSPRKGACFSLWLKAG